MIEDPVTVDVLADRDDVAGVVARYNLLAVPVVDDARHLVGIVTVDDAIDTILPASWRRRGTQRRDAELARSDAALGRPPATPARAASPRARSCACAGGSAAGAASSRSWRSWARASSPGSPATTPAASRRTASWARPTGLTLLWIFPITIAILAIVQEMAARLGVVTGQGLSDLIRDRFGVRPTAFAMVVLLVANLANTVAEFSGAAAALEIFGISRYLVVPIVAVAIWALVIKASYRTVERVFLCGHRGVPRLHRLGGPGRPRLGRRSGAALVTPTPGPRSPRRSC